MNRVAMITGGSGGLGVPLAKHLASKGTSVAILYNQNSSSADELVSILNSEGLKAMSVQADVTNDVSVERAVESILTEFGSIDYLINCAGISRNALSWKMSSKDWESTLNANLSGVYQCTRAVLPIMRKKGFGRIINISSIVGSIGVAGTGAYAASKAGVEGFSRSVAVEVARNGITVNSLALGYFDRGIIAQVPKEALDKIIQNIPVGRLGTVEEMFHAIDCLCSDNAGYLTGQTLHLNGGLYLT